MSLSSYFWDCGLVDAAALAVAEVLCAQRWDGPLADLSCQDLVEAIRINQARHNDLTKVREELCSRAREQGSRESKDSGKHKIVPPPFPHVLLFHQAPAYFVFRFLLFGRSQNPLHRSTGSERGIRG